MSAAAWPERSGDAFSDWINRGQKYVVSNTLTEKDISWRPTKIIRGGDITQTVSELRTQPGGYIYVYGSATMVRSLLDADLVDELLLTVEPIILGGGKTIFVPNGKALPSTLESSVRTAVSNPEVRL